MDMLSTIIDGRPDPYPFDGTTIASTQVGCQPRRGILTPVNENIRGSLRRENVRLVRCSRRRMSRFFADDPRMGR
jgi:hypothetical protein